MKKECFSVWCFMASGGCLCVRTGKHMFAVLLRLAVCLSSWDTHIYSLVRFSGALQPFLDSLQMVQNHVVPGKLTWPLTNEVVLETQPDYLKVCGSFVMHIWIKMYSFFGACDHFEVLHFYWKCHWLRIQIILRDCTLTLVLRVFVLLPFWL